MRYMTLSQGIGLCKHGNYSMRIVGIEVRKIGKWEIKRLGDWVIVLAY